MSSLENPSIGQLHKKLPDLQKSSEVSDAVDKHKRLTDEKVPNTPEARLEVYMERLEKVFLNEDEETRKRNIKLLLPKIHEAFVIKREDVPESYFELQQRIARERGQAVETIPKNVREQMKDVIIEDQTQSLDAWIDYLSSDDAMYPTWFKYFVFRNITKLSQFDKEHGKFKERTKSTTAPFPDIYREPLAQVCDMYERVAKGDPATLNNPEFQEFIGKKFPAQYATLIQKTLEQAQESREQVAGQWVKYVQGDMEGAEVLYASLQGKGTGWCTAGQSTAKAQIANGDFYVYYTNDEAGNPVNPRLAIRMGDEKIGEVRGVLPHQEVEPLLQDVLDEKLSEFGSEADEYRKKVVDMKRLTKIDNGSRAGQELTSEDLRFLYEIDSSIEGFGYSRDPRIEALMKTRSVDTDLKTIFGTNVKIATQYDDIEETTEVAVVNGKICSKYNKDTEKQFVNRCRYNRIRKLISNGQPITRDDLAFIFPSSPYGQNILGPARMGDLQKAADLKLIKQVLGLKDNQVAKSYDEITEATVLYLPEIGAYLDDQPKENVPYGREKIDYAKCLGDEKLRLIIGKKLERSELLTKQELQFVFRQNNAFSSDVSYSQQRKYREEVRPENLQLVFGNDLAQALDDLPKLLGDWEAWDSTNLDEQYFPFLEVGEDGEFMACTMIAITELPELNEVDAKLRSKGYKLANKNELENFIAHNKFTDRSEIRTVYGAGFLWRDYLSSEQDKSSSRTGHVLSYDDKRLEGEGLVPSNAVAFDIYDTDRQSVMIAVTRARSSYHPKGYSITEEKKYNTDDRKDDILDSIEDKAFKKTQKK